jgi:radical SAM protein
MPLSATLSSARTLRPAVDFRQRPMLVFWETTRACLLACRHCRASASAQAAPGELSYPEGRELIEQIAGFGRPYPILVFTGGDCLMRPDLFDLVDYATSLGVPVALSPSVTPLTGDLLDQIAASGIKAVSISLDGASAATHDGIRGIPDHFEATIAALHDLVAAGMRVQVNTTVMRANARELADIANLVAQAGCHFWEVFFLVHVGRGVATGAISAAEHEDVCHFLYDASGYGFTVRTVEAPFFRRVAAQRLAGGPPTDSALYSHLSRRLTELLGPPTSPPRAQTSPTRDGKGIIFIAHDGEVYPAGFLPIGLGNVRSRSLGDIYRNDPLLRAIRDAQFTGRCGTCDFSDLCGGSRSRAYAATGDPLADDPACLSPVPAASF